MFRPKPKFDCPHCRRRVKLNFNKMDKVADVWPTIRLFTCRCGERTVFDVRFGQPGVVEQFSYFKLEKSVKSHASAEAQRIYVLKQVRHHFEQQAMAKLSRPKDTQPVECPFCHATIVLRLPNFTAQELRIGIAYPCPICHEVFPVIFEKPIDSSEVADFSAFLGEGIEIFNRRPLDDYDVRIIKLGINTLGPLTPKDDLWG